MLILDMLHHVLTLGVHIFFHWSIERELISGLKSLQFAPYVHIHILYAALYIYICIVGLHTYMYVWCAFRTN